MATRVVFTWLLHWSVPMRLYTGDTLSQMNCPHRHFLIMYVRSWSSCSHIRSWSSCNMIVHYVFMIVTSWSRVVTHVQAVSPLNSAGVAKIYIFQSVPLSCDRILMNEWMNEWCSFSWKSMWTPKLDWGQSHLPKQSNLLLPIWHVNMYCTYCWKRVCELALLFFVLFFISKVGKNLRTPQELC